MPFTKSSQPSKSPLLGFTMFYQHISLIEEVVTIPEKLSHRGVRKVVIVSKKFLEWSEFGNTSSMCSSKEPTVWGTWTPCAGIQCVYIYDMIYGIWHMTHYNTLYVSIHYIYIYKMVTITIIQWSYIISYHIQDTVRSRPPSSRRFTAL